MYVDKMSGNWEKFPSKFTTAQGDATNLLVFLTNTSKLKDIQFIIK